MATKNQPQMVTDYNVYDRFNKMLGVASVTMPTLAWQTMNMNGAGIAGIVEVVGRGMPEAMTLGLDFRMVTDEAYKLATPELHIVTLRAAQQYEDGVNGKVVTKGVKHVFGLMPKTLNTGSIKQAATHDGSGQYAVRSWKCYIDDELVIDIDQLNGKCFIYGVDYRAEINAVI